MFLLIFPRRTPSSVQQFKGDCCRLWKATSENREDVAKYILEEFPAVAGDLEQLLLMIDQGQAVDISGLSERSLFMHLRRLFMCLNLKENEDKVFLLLRKTPTLKIDGPIIRSQMQTRKQLNHLDSQEKAPLGPPASECRHVNKNVDDTKENSVGTRRTIGPEMPSASCLLQLPN